MLVSEDSRATDRIFAAVARDALRRALPGRIFQPLNPPNRLPGKLPLQTDLNRPAQSGRNDSE
jgi:hypothetical protein